LYSASEIAKYPFKFNVSFFMPLIYKQLSIFTNLFLLFLCMRISDICYIYALLDPQTGVVRYIGKTIRPKERLKQHIDRSKKPRYKRNVG